MNKYYCTIYIPQIMSEGESVGLYVEAATSERAVEILTLGFGNPSAVIIATLVT